MQSTLASRLIRERPRRYRRIVASRAHALDRAHGRLVHDQRLRGDHIRQHTVFGDGDVDFAKDRVAEVDQRVVGDIDDQGPQSRLLVIFFYQDFRVTSR